MKSLRSSALALVIAVSCLSGCGSYTFLYDTRDVAPMVVGGQTPSVLVVDLIDARQNPGDVATQGRRGNSYSTLWPEPVYFQPQQWTNLNTSVRAHLTASGVAGPVPQYSALLPTTADDVQAILTRANEEGKDFVLFLRLVDARAGGSMALGPLIVRLLTILLISGVVPLAISESIPINDELCYAEYELVLVDPKGRNLLKRIRGRHALERTDSSGWGHYPIGEMPAVMKQALQAGLEELSRHFSSGEEDPDVFHAEEVVRRVPEPTWIPPEGSVLYDSDNPDKPFVRAN